jgi:voltage-gated potassium channel
VNIFQEQSSRTIWSGIVLLLLMIVGGTLGFMLIEHWRLIDAFFMTVITISTVGYGEVKPLSDEGHIFASVLIFFSLGSIAYVGYLARFIFDGDFLKYYKIYKVENRIHRLYNHVVICGYGRSGEQASIELSGHNASFVIIEKNEVVVNNALRENPNLMIIQGDATHEEMLIRAGIQRAKALITTTPSDAQNVFVVLSARGLNPKVKIISRAVDYHSEEKLKRAGADNVIMPELIGGRRMAKLVAQPDVVEFVEHILLQNTLDARLEEISCKEMADQYIGKSIAHFRQREISGATIIGIKDTNGRYYFNPGSDYALDPGDQLFVLGSPEQVRILKKALNDTDEL